MTTVAAPKGWRPLVPAVLQPISEKLIKAAMAAYPEWSRDDAVKSLQSEEGSQTWINDIYQVMVRYSPNKEWAHINIRRRDGKPILRDWRHFQQIKNEILGPECEAIELYPAESRCVDTSNKYHLWGSTDPTFRFPFGWTNGDRRDADGADHAGIKQRKF